MNIIKRIIRDIQGDFEDKYSFRTNISQFQIADMDSITISPHDGVTSALDSKIGGMPYLPEKFTYPMDLRSGRKESPLAFLAQINFSQMPPLEGFPKEGILQFYIGTDSLFGLNLKDPTDNAGFRVIYFREPIKQSRLLEEIPVRIEAEAELPVKRPLQIGFTPEKSIIGNNDFRFEEALLEALRQRYPLVSSVKDIPQDVQDEIDDLCNACGSRIGGFPYFTQYDPREDDPELQDYSILLFQLDSDENSGIRWGDSGVANFFITPHDLRRHDFSRVLFHWDCH